MPLTPEQRERMFVAEALQGHAERLEPEHLERLRQMDLLVAGDFATVQRQLELLGEPCAPDEFLSMLETEHRVKPEVRERRSVGFVH
jgi:hypothetical protein